MPRHDGGKLIEHYRKHPQARHLAQRIARNEAAAGKGTAKRPRRQLQEATDGRS